MAAAAGLDHREVADAGLVQKEVEVAADAFGRREVSAAAAVDHRVVAAATGLDHREVVVAADACGRR